MPRTSSCSRRRLDRAAERAELGLGVELGFVCSYFGTMGEANDLSQVVRAAPLVEGVTFVLLGDGKRRRGARARSARSRRGECALPAPARRDKRSVARLAAASDACLTIFKDVPVLSTCSPNKLFDTFAAGRPAIVNQPGWMRELVEHNEAGLFVRPGDPGDLAEKVAWLRDHPDEAARYGRNARGLAEREFDRDDARGEGPRGPRGGGGRLTELSYCVVNTERARAPARLPRGDRAHPPGRSGATRCSCSTTPPTTARPRPCARRARAATCASSRSSGATARRRTTRRCCRRPAGPTACS